MKLILALGIPLAGCGASRECPPQTSHGTVPFATVPDMYPSCSTLCQPDADLGLPLLGCESNIIDGGVAVSCTFAGCSPASGRRPAGFDTIALSAHNDIGEWLARAAALEAASVPAFRILAMELRAHGAPEILVDAAWRAADQETQHAVAMTRLAKCYGGTAASFAIAVRPVRPLEAIAIENAIEGRVREAFGAAVAFEQSQHAGDRHIRAAFSIIAPEEMGHTRLATAVDEWAQGMLSPPQRRRVDEARDRARAQLARELETEALASLRHVIGLPNATRAQELIAAV